MIRIAALLMLGIAVAAEDVPDAKATRAHIDGLIAACVEAKRPATLGLVRDAVRLSISYGAPAYNNGDHQGCGDFYAATTAALVKAFAADGATTAAAAPAIRDLAASAKRSAGMEDADRRAWSLRFGFDQADLAGDALISHGQGLTHESSDFFRRGDYEEAELGYAQAMALTAEVMGEEPASVPVDLRAAAALRGQALLMLGKREEAAAAIAAAVPKVPELVNAELDLHSLYANRFDLDRALLELEDWVGKRPKDADARFLLGFERRFSGARDKAEGDFAAVLGLDPKHAGAKLFAPDAGDGAPAQKAAEPVP